MKHRKDARLPKTLADLSDVLAEAARFVGRVGTAERFLGDPDLMLAAEALVNRVGEIADRLPEGFHATHPEVDWSGIIGTRVLVAHHYERIEHRLIWEYLSVTFPDVAERLGDELPEPRPLLIFSAAAVGPSAIPRDPPGQLRLCGKWMPIARAYCALRRGHAGHHRSGR